MFTRRLTDDVGVLYTEVIERVGQVLREAPAGSDALTVPACPDWDVADLLAHLAGMPSALLQRDYPGSDAQVWIDGHLAERRGRSALENWEEWSAVGAAYARLIDKNEGAWGGLLYDAIIHEDDLRGALGRPLAGDEDAIGYALDRQLPGLDEQARTEGIGTLEITCGDVRWSIGEGEPAMQLGEDDRWELVRALGARRSEGRLRAMSFSGDPSAWIAVISHELPLDDRVQ